MHAANLCVDLLFLFLLYRFILHPLACRFLPVYWIWFCRARRSWERRHEPEYQLDLKKEYF